MKNILIVGVLLFNLLLFSSSAIAQQKGTIQGTVTDALSGEELIGVNISYAAGKGVVTNFEGKYKLDLPYGDYEITYSFVGYERVTKKITLNKKNYVQNIALSIKTLQKVEIVADVARTRETPVAFSVVAPKTLEEELANQDLPMVLNRTPGVYATQQGGGDGDSRINIRGFSQRNVAVMIDGVPVNDMENGWVYWSNWFGLDNVVRSIQVQRGLSASKLALPSVGGTMNIITKGIDQNRGLKLKQDFGSDGFLRTSFAISTGQMDKGWAISFAGAYKQGDGWVDQTWTQGFFGYLRVDKRIGNHTITLSGFGAPQSHGQRSYTNSIAEFSTKYANKIGLPDSLYIKNNNGLKPTNLGLRFNQNWGYINRWHMNGTDTVHSGRERLNEKKNYYFKPQFSLRDYWRINDKLFMSSVVYVSIGDGGGTGLTSASNLGPVLSDGTLNFQKAYDDNRASTTGGTILRSSINKHQWYGGISTLDYKVTEKLKIAVGIDLRQYRGEHYRIAYDMLGADYYNDFKNGLIDKTNPSTERRQGDIMSYHNDGLVKWAGLFGQVQWKTEKISLFANITGARTWYKRIDYFRKQDLVIDGEVYREQVGYTYGFDPQTLTFGGVMDTVEINGKQYTIESDEARVAQSKWHAINGATIKAGANYNFSDKMNAFFNLGYMNKAPRFNNVFDYSNNLYKDIRNEEIMAIELGYSYVNSWMTLNLNGYITQWNNKPADNAPSVRIDDETFKVNINGMNALHQGVEFELGMRPIKGLLLETVVSVGDWKWTSKDSAEVIDEVNQVVIKKIFFNAENIKVGDAAQLQIRQSARYEIIKGLSVRASLTYFGNHYSNFDPLSLDPVEYPNSFDENGNPRQSWKVPDYFLVDAGVAYSWKSKKATKFKVQLTVLNLLDQVYISDASNNDQYTGQSWNNFDAASAGVFFGMGRRIMTSFSVSI